MGKVWNLDTETKGTGANMGPIEKAQKRPEPAPARSNLRRPDAWAPATSRPSRSRAEPPRETTSTSLPAGHVRKKATGEIGRIESVDPRAGTAREHWLKRGTASTVRLSAISRR